MENIFTGSLIQLICCWSVKYVIQCVSQIWRHIKKANTYVHYLPLLTLTGCQMPSKELVVIGQNVIFHYLRENIWYRKHVNLTVVFYLCIEGGGSHNLPADQQRAAAAVLGGKVRVVQPSSRGAYEPGEAESEAPQPQHHQRTHARQHARRARQHTLPGQRREPMQPAAQVWYAPRNPHKHTDYTNDPQWLEWCVCLLFLDDHTLSMCNLTNITLKTIVLF